MFVAVGSVALRHAARSRPVSRLRMAVHVLVFAAVAAAADVDRIARRRRQRRGCRRHEFVDERFGCRRRQNVGVFCRNENRATVLIKSNQINQPINQLG